MDKCLVFRLEKQIGNNVPGHGILVSPCFELVKEFEVEDHPKWSDYLEACDYAKQYSVDNKVRTFVVKGSVFG
jgi:hypothetical protein